MGKNYKEVLAYHYLHGISDIPRNMLVKLKKKWSRHNFNIGEYRADRVRKRQEIFDKDWNNELKNNEYGNKNNEPVY